MKKMKNNFQPMNFLVVFFVLFIYLHTVLGILKTDFIDTSRSNMMVFLPMVYIGLMIQVSRKNRKDIISHFVKLYGVILTIGLAGMYYIGLSELEVLDIGSFRIDITIFIVFSLLSIISVYLEDKQGTTTIFKVETKKGFYRIDALYYILILVLGFVYFWYMLFSSFVLYFSV
jgi:hypothetical protein